jgi:hypothetical protein
MAYWPAGFRGLRNFDSYEGSSVPAGAIGSDLTPQPKKISKIVNLKLKR